MPPGIITAHATQINMTEHLRGDSSEVSPVVVVVVDGKCSRVENSIETLTHNPLQNQLTMLTVLFDLIILNVLKYNTLAWVIIKSLHGNWAEYILILLPFCVFCELVGSN